MYKIERKKVICEEFMLGDETVRVEIIPDRIAGAFYQKQSAVIAAQVKIRQAKEAGKAPDECLTKEYGAAITAFLQLVLGEENSAKVLTFFENNYLELFSQVMPFVTDVLVPQIVAALKDLRAGNMAKYTGRGNRQQRRWFSKHKPA